MRFSCRPERLVPDGKPLAGRGGLYRLGSFPPGARESPVLEARRQSAFPLCQVSFGWAVDVETWVPDALTEDPPEPPAPPLNPAFERPVPEGLSDVVEVEDPVETEGTEGEPFDPAVDEPTDAGEDDVGDALAPWLRAAAFEASPRSADACAVASCAAATSLW